jgi:hypothetical protein
MIALCQSVWLACVRTITTMTGPVQLLDAPVSADWGSYVCSAFWLGALSKEPSQSGQAHPRDIC